jgi:hypothetical protein
MDDKKLDNLLKSNFNKIPNAEEGAILEGVQFKMRNRPSLIKRAVSVAGNALMLSLAAGILVLAGIFLLHQGSHGNYALAEGEAPQEEGENYPYENPYENPYDTPYESPYETPAPVYAVDPLPAHTHCMCLLPDTPPKIRNFAIIPVPPREGEDYYTIFFMLMANLNEEGIYDINLRIDFNDENLRIDFDDENLCPFLRQIAQNAQSSIDGSLYDWDISGMDWKWACITKPLPTLADD